METAKINHGYSLSSHLPLLPDNCRQQGWLLKNSLSKNFAKIGSRQEALQTIFPSLLDISYRRIFDVFQKNRLFQQPQDFSTSIRIATS